MKEQNENQAIEEMAQVIERTEQIARDAHCGLPSPTMYAKDLCWKGYRKRSEGEWKDQYNGKYANPIYVCSVCGKGTLLTPYINELNNMEMIQALSPYCPNCGAKMKGDKNEQREAE